MTRPIDMFAKDNHREASHGVTNVDSEASDPNIPHDPTSTNAIGVDKNDGKETDGHEIIQHISFNPRKAARYV
jgi:hypothetical protein